MPRTPVLPILLVGWLLAGCGASAGARVVDMPGSSEDTGSVTLIFSNKASGVVVAVGGTLVIDGADVKRLQIHKVATGYADLAIAANGVERQMRVWVESGRDTAVPVGSPPAPPKQNPLLTAGLSVVAFLISRAATDLLL